ncbi:MAG: PQQ-binding-like beta-propeller repeat protein [Verrucomicrobia bacterium]|nr:PQQ-binding-like beta-propeller repeat protein [Verrucomicrobiota bacterium]
MIRYLLSGWLVCVGWGLFAANEWPQFRGPAGDGQTTSRKLPLTFTESDNVVWQVDIPGQGWSSPVVSEGMIWMATATDEGKSLRAIAVDRKTGALRHNVELFQVAAPEPIHALNSHASPTPVIEDGRVYFFFGMYGAAALDSQTGEVLWKNTDLPHDHGKNGPGSSPILWRDLLILNCDGTVHRYVTALNKKTGKTVWRTERSNGADLEGKVGDLKKAYHTPTVIQVNGREELISMGAFRLGGYDPATGKELWYVDIPGFSNVTRPVYGHGLIYLATGFMKPEFWAIRPGGSGDVSATHVAWKVARQAPQKPSPVLIGNEVYMVADNGIVTCMDAREGTIHYSERLGGEFSASPLVMGDRIYFFDQTGKVTVLAAGKKFEVLGTSSLGDGFMASPAVAGDSLILRSKSKLYRVEARPKVEG